MNKILQFATSPENVHKRMLNFGNKLTIYEDKEYLLKFKGSESDGMGNTIVQFLMLYKEPVKVLAPHDSKFIEFKVYKSIDIREVLKHSMGFLCYDAE